MKCLFEECESDAVIDGNYCDKHQWNVMLESALGGYDHAINIADADARQTWKGGGDGKSKGADPGESKEAD